MDMNPHFRIEISDKPLQFTDVNAAILALQNAGAFTLPFMRTDPATDRRQIAAQGDDRASLTDISVGQGMNKTGNVIADRATLATERSFAIQAALGFGNRLPGRKTGVDFIKGKIRSGKIGFLINQHRQHPFAEKLKQAMRGFLLHRHFFIITISKQADNPKITGTSASPFRRSWGTCCN